jgi:hypothetical protein
MTLGHSSTNVASTMVEAQGCPGLVAKAGAPWGKPLEQQSLGARPQRCKHPGKALGGKAPRVKQFWVGVGVGALPGSAPKSV